jgi:hypothetical protein
MELPSSHVEHHDARGLQIPDDIVKYSGCLESDPETFWSSNQFYVKANHPMHIIGKLAAIPDHHFYLIQSLCFDFLWRDPSGLPLSHRENTTGSTGDHKFTQDLDKVIEKVLHQGNKGLAVKIFWSTAMSTPLERLCTWNEDEQIYMYKKMESHSAQFRRFNAKCKSLGYDENRIKLVARVEWSDDMPQTNKDFCQEFWPSDGLREDGSDDRTWNELNDWYEVQLWEWEQLEHEKNVFEIDPISKSFIFKELWKSSYLTDGLMWDPVRGHFNPSSDLSHRPFQLRLTQEWPDPNAGNPSRRDSPPMDTSCTNSPEPTNPVIALHTGTPPDSLPNCIE